MREWKQGRSRRKASAFQEPRRAEAESADQHEFRFRWLYLILGAVGVAAIASSGRLTNVAWIDRYAAEVATEAFGMLVTLLVVQRLLERQERARRLRGSIGALRRGNRALSSIAWTWAEIVSDSLRRVPSTSPQTLEDLFAAHLTEDIAYWDPHAERADAAQAEEGAEAGEPSGRWAIRRFTAAQEALNEIIMTYSGSLDPVYIEAIDELVDDPFLRTIQDIMMDDPALEPRERRVRLNAARAHREAHFHRLLATISIHNSLAAEAGPLRSRRLAPRTGSVGLRLALDHDLKVDLAIDPRWWLARTLPNAGARTPASF